MLISRHFKLLGILPGLILFSTAAISEDEAAPKINYKDNVLPIFQTKCNACHNNDKKKGGLALDTFGGTMAGGGSGSVVEPGDPDNSRLYLVVAHEEEPAMPPNSPKIPDPDLETLKAWILAGAPETAGSTVAMKAKPKLNFTLDPSAIGKPIGEPAFPAEGLSTEPEAVADRPNAILALAASPWAPLVAIGGYKQASLYDTRTLRLVAVFPFPEGNIHCLQFSRDGGILLAAGGRTAEKGLAVAFDVKTGDRLFEVGNEYDVALSADISPDRTLVALGGPGRVVRVYRTADGELAFEARKHTDWITAVRFSPDGVLLASGDRNGGLLVWEAATGREFYDLRGHSGMITSTDWRLDSNVLASASEDGTARLWEMQNGSQLKSWASHAGGAEWVAFAKDGRLATAGRDGLTKLWDGNGAHQRDFENLGDVATRATLTFDDATLIAGGYTGEVRAWNTADGAKRGTLAANPLPVSARLENVQMALPAAQVQVETVALELPPLQAAATEKTAACEAAQAAHLAAKTQAEAATAALQAATATRDSRQAILTTAQTALETATQAQAQALQLRDAITGAAAAESIPAAELALSAATTSQQAVQAAVQTATASRDQAAAQLPALEASAKTIAEALATATSALEAATQARDAANAALAPKLAASQAAEAHLAALKAEQEALTRELQLAASAPKTDESP